MSASRGDWAARLRGEVAGSERFWAELERQARAHARELAGVDIGDGRYALVPPDGGFEVRFSESRAVDGSTQVLGSVGGDLVEVDGRAYPVVLAWCAVERPGRRVMPDAPWTEIEPVRFFWTQFSVEEVEPRVSFYVRWDAPEWPGLWLELAAIERFAPEDGERFVAAVDGAIAAWNDGSAGRIRYRGPAEASPDGARLSVYIDFGTAERGAVSAVLRAIDERGPKGAIARCLVSSGPAPGGVVERG